MDGRGLHRKAKPMLNESWKDAMRIKYTEPVKKRYKRQFIRFHNISPELATLKRRFAWWPVITLAKEYVWLEGYYELQYWRVPANPDDLGLDYSTFNASTLRELRRYEK